MKKFISAILLIAMVLSTVACGNTQQEAASSSATATQVTSPKGEVRSYLTGEWVAKETNSKRPLAVMLSNQPEAPNQSGISDASIVYEAPAEQNYGTRFMGIFEDWKDIKKMGSVRSCRTYYVYFMMEFDSIYVHAGQAKFALPYLEKEFVDDINSVYGSDADAFYWVPEEGRAQEHTLFISGENALAKSKEKKYRLEHESSYTGHYVFNEDDDKMISLSDGETAEIAIPGYYISEPWFEFDAEKGVYNRYQYRRELNEDSFHPVKQFDQASGDVLEYSNIIFQYCDISPYLDYEWNNEPTKYLNIDCLSGGKGKFITNGKAIDITWSKDSEWGVTHYYDKNGKEITLNQGKTWVCIIDTKELDRVEISSIKNASISSKTMDN